MMSAEPWRGLFDRSIRAYYDGRSDADGEACERLLSRDDLPAHVRRQTRRNQVFYAPRLAVLVPSAAPRRIAIPVQPGWSRFNPSIAADGGGYRMIVRSSNYRYSGAFIALPAGERVVRTTNHLVDLDAALDVRRVRAIVDRTDRAGTFPFPVAGYEDCRLSRHRGAWRASATTRDRDPAGTCQVALLDLDDDGFRDLRLLSEVGSGRHEKNWAPLPGADGLRFVSSWSPTVLLRYDDATETVSPIGRRPAPTIATDFRGGSGLVPISDGFLAIVHETVPFEDGGRVYLHRFVALDRRFTIERISPQFFFVERTVEFCAGLTERDGTLIAAFGVEDREAYLATMRLDEVLSMLRSVADEASFANDDAVRPRPTARSARPGDASPAEPPEPTAGTTPFPVPASPGSPWLVSVTLTGSDGPLIGDALRSVAGWVDACLVVDTGAADDTLAVARSVAGKKLVVRTFPWRDDFAAARNAALGFAAELGAAWAVILDTDERLALGEVDIRAALAATAADVLFVPEEGGAYAKERCFRLPTRGQFDGPTHEAFVGAGSRSGRLAGARFAEVPKSQDGYRRKFERDAAMLARYAETRPDEPRWRYYLGDALQGLGRHPEAIAAYRSCAALNGWDEEAAWACYRAAECWLALGTPDEAVASCAAGLAHHAGLGELPWLAGFASWRAGRHRQAVAWSRLAIALGHFRGDGRNVPRLGFRTPRALYEGPYDVLRFALRALGDEAGAAEAERLFGEAAAAREAALRQP